MVTGNAVEIVEKFTYHLDNTGGSDAEVIRRIVLTRDCMKALDLDRNIWRSSITSPLLPRFACTLLISCQFCFTALRHGH